MKQLAFVAVMVGAGVLAACGGGDDDGVVLVDSGPSADAMVQQCDPVEQTGCGDGEKCAQVAIAEGAEKTDCVPDGDVAIGEACETGPLGEETGYDDCVAGAQCVNAICRAICSSPPDTCDDDFSCTFFVDLFDDVMTAEVGVCSQVCDPIAQDCSLEGEGCYFSIFDEEGQATCVATPDDSAKLGQGEECVINPASDLCFLNGCGAGFAPPPPLTALPDEVLTVCTSYCQPTDCYLIDPDGDGMGDLVAPGCGEGVPDDGDPKTPLVNCSVDRIGAALHQCRFFQAIGDGAGGSLDYIPIEYGFCVDPAVANQVWGNCELNSEEHIVFLYDEAGGGDAGNMAVDDFCTKSPEACAALCISNETANTLFDAYCKAPPIEPSPFCEETAARAHYLGLRRERVRKALEALQ
jgi:hypothetical protein